MWEGTALTAADMKIGDDRAGHITFSLRGKLVSTIEGTGAVRKLTIYKEGIPSTEMDITGRWASASANTEELPPDYDPNDPEAWCVFMYGQLAFRLGVVAAAEAAVIVACTAYMVAGVLVWPLGGLCLLAMDAFGDAVGSYLDKLEELRENCPSWITEPIFCWRDGWYHLCP